MGKFLLVVAIGLWPSIVAAQAVKAVEVTSLPDGDYVLTMTGGVPSIRPLVLLQPSPLPGPSPVVPTVLTARGILFRDSAAKEADPKRSETAKGMALLYRETAKMTRANGASPASITDAVTLAAVLKFGQDTLLSGRPVASDWHDTRAILTAQWAKAAQEGAKVADYGKLLDEAADGYDASATDKSISPEMIALIMQIIQIIMKIFFPAMLAF